MTDEKRARRADPDPIGSGSRPKIYILSGPGPEIFILSGPHPGPKMLDRRALDERQVGA